MPSGQLLSVQALTDRVMDVTVNSLETNSSKRKKAEALTSAHFTSLHLNVSIQFHRASHSLGDYQSCAE